jgi:hypothetical protein
MTPRGRKRLGKTARLTFELYPQLDEEIRRVADEKGLYIGDLIISCLARELNVETPEPQRAGRQMESEQMELSDA